MSNVIPIMPFSGRPTVIVAGGPSVTLRQIRQIAIARSQNRCWVIAVNDAVYPCWFADLLHACDARWWDNNPGALNFPGVKTALDRVSLPNVYCLTNTGIEGYDDAPGCIRSGSNSGYQAIHIAAKVGARRIILAGFDFSGEQQDGDGARDHWFGRHQTVMDKNSNTAKWREHLRGLTDELLRRGIVIQNASPSSTIDWLPKVNMEHSAWAA